VEQECDWSYMLQSDVCILPVFAAIAVWLLWDWKKDFLIYSNASHSCKFPMKFYSCDFHVCVLCIVRLFSRNSSVYIWSQSRHVAQNYVFDTYDGLHLVSRHNGTLVASPALSIRSQTLWNFYCNEFNNDPQDTDLCCAQKHLWLLICSPVRVCSSNTNQQ